MTYEIRTRGYHPKIFRMLNAMEDRQRIEEAEQKQNALRQNNYDHYAAALIRLQQVDPTGWEAWYDDDKNIPENIIWVDAAPIIQRVLDRIVEVSGVPFAWKPKKEYYFDWEITRPAKRGSQRVRVAILRGLTKAQFAGWWQRYSQTGWKAKVFYNPIKLERQLQKGIPQ